MAPAHRPKIGVARALVCGRIEPPLVDYGGGHFAACYHPLNVDGATRARVEPAALERDG